MSFVDTVQSYTPFRRHTDRQTVKVMDAQTDNRTDATEKDVVRILFWPRGNSERLSSSIDCIKILSFHTAAEETPNICFANELWLKKLLLDIASFFSASSFASKQTLFSYRSSSHVHGCSYPLAQSPNKPTKSPKHCG